MSTGDDHDRRGGRRRDGARNDQERGRPAVPAPGKVALADRIDGTRPAPEVLKSTLDEAREHLAAIRASLPDLRAAVDPAGARDLEQARSLSRNVEVDLVRAETKVRVAAELAFRTRSLDSATAAAALQAVLADIKAEAAPLLALKPPSYVSDDERMAAILTHDPAALAVVDDGEAREKADWNETLDRQGARDAEAGGPEEREPHREKEDAKRDGPAKNADPEAPADGQEPRIVVDDGEVAAIVDGVLGATPPTERDAFDEATSRMPTGLPHRAEMEASFGTSFSGVEAHTGVSSIRDSLGAEAAARGNVVAFADADPTPELVAHELTHVRQQEGTEATVAAKSTVSSPGDAAELEADAVADAVARGEPASSVPISAAATAGLYRASIYESMRAATRRSLDPNRAAAEHLDDARGTDVNARAYVQLNRGAIVAELRALLDSRDLPTGHPGLAWTDLARFKGFVAHRLNVEGADSFVEKLRGAIAPVDLWTLVDQHRVITKADVHAAAAEHLGHDAATRASAARGL